MPVDKNAVLNGSNGKAQQPAPPQSQTVPAEEATALAALSQTAAGTIRQSIGAMNQLAEKLEDQRDLVTTHAADRITAILDPVSIQAEIAAKTVAQLEGKAFIPFELEAIELPEMRRYVPQLPQSYVSQSSAALLLSSSSSSIEDATSSETICNGNSRTPVPAGTGFGGQRKAS